MNKGKLWHTRLTFIEFQDCGKPLLCENWAYSLSTGGFYGGGLAGWLAGWLSDNIQYISGFQTF